MEKFRVTRTEINTYTVELYAENHEQAEKLAKKLNIENKRWTDGGYVIDYVAQELEEDD